MFCPFLSMGKDRPIDCGKDCALYNGSIDGVTQKECILFTIGKDVGGNALKLRELSEAADEVAGVLQNIAFNRRSED